MKYLVTWVEGFDVCYKFVNSKEEIDIDLIKDKNLIIAPLTDE